MDIPLFGFGAKQLLDAGRDSVVDVARDTRHARTSEAAETQIETFITRRHEKRVESEGERREREAWQETEIRQAQQRREANRLAWCEYHRQQAERHRATLTDLLQHHQDQAEKYRENRH
jgi:hypothetical protein